jgi:hypothetical protein
MKTRLIKKVAALSAIAVGMIAASASARPQPALVMIPGPEFEGGAKDLVGTSFGGREVNTIYSLANGARSSMQAKFQVHNVPKVPLFVHLTARDDDAPEASSIVVRLNGKILFEGRNQFSAERYDIRKLPIPEGTVVPGENTLVIASGEKAGPAGAPPWFQVASCVIAPENFVVLPNLHKQFSIELPDARKPFPEPLPPGAEPGFRIRGTKGWAWTPEQYLAEIPWLAKFKMNFLMNCYLSMFDIENHANWGSGEANRWWEEIPESKKAAYAKVARSCQEHGIVFCFGMNPNLASKRFIKADSPADVDALYRNYAWAQSVGVRWFNISLDDISQGIDASSHARVVNTILQRLREKDPKAEMIFCPTYYWGDGTETKQKEYLEVLARDLHPDVYLFWTGDAVVGPITRKGAETFRRISGHRLFLWDNYPVNDDAPTMHLGPVVDRDADLCEVVDGYMSNPLCKQNQGNRIPLATCADYAYNPDGYDPSRSIGQAILHAADAPDQREALRDLVEAYAGMLIWSPPQRGTGFNGVREQFEKISNLQHSHQAAVAYVRHMEDLANRMRRAFPDSFAPERRTLQEDVQFLQQRLKQKFD